jgi:hypothetical protein
MQRSKSISDDGTHSNIFYGNCAHIDKIKSVFLNVNNSYIDSQCYIGFVLLALLQASKMYFRPIWYIRPAVS